LTALEKKQSHFQTRKVVVISAGHFVHDVYSSFLAPFLPLLIGKFQLSMVLAGSLTVFFRLPSLINPFFGVISDRTNVLYLAIAAPALTAAGMSLLGVAPNYPTVCFLLLAAGTSAAIFHVIGPVMIAQVGSRNLGKGMGFWMTGGELARTAGPLIAIFVVSMWGFDGSYPIMSAGILASVLLYFSMKEMSSVSEKQPKGGLREAWRSLSRIMIPLAGVMISRAALAATLTAFLPIYMVNSGRSLWIGGASLSVLELSGTLGTFFGGTISDRVGRRAVLLATLPTSSLLLLAFVYAPEWLQFPILLCLGCGIFVLTPVNLAIVQDHCGSHRGAATGVFMTIHFMSTALITILVGWLADLLGLKLAFTLSAFLGLAGVPIIFLLPKAPPIIEER
jgi:FSR family fosmidomycin resistance protein-like MFS transporter